MYICFVTANKREKEESVGTRMQWTITDESFGMWIHSPSLSLSMSVRDVSHDAFDDRVIISLSFSFSLSFTLDSGAARRTKQIALASWPHIL